MKAIVNIGLREVTIEYSADVALINTEGVVHNFEVFIKAKGSKKAMCKQTICFRDADEWRAVLLLDGRLIDFHYDFENRSEFDSRKDWASYIFQGYNYENGEPQQYNNQIVKKVIVKY
jgi:hypothetical protein